MTRESSLPKDTAHLPAARPGKLPTRRTRRAPKLTKSCPEVPPGAERDSAQIQRGLAEELGRTLALFGETFDPNWTMWPNYGQTLSESGNIRHG